MAPIASIAGSTPSNIRRPERLLKFLVMIYQCKLPAIAPSVGKCRVDVLGLLCYSTTQVRPKAGGARLNQWSENSGPSRTTESAGLGHTSISHFFLLQHAVPAPPVSVGPREDFRSPPRTPVRA